MDVNINDVNVVELVNLNLSLEAIEDKIIVLHDDFKSGYECQDCKETGFMSGCDKCDNVGMDRFGQTCTKCNGQGESFKYTCTTCKGQKLIIEIPQSARTLPTTGIVVSMGPLCPAMVTSKKIKTLKERLKIVAGLPTYDIIGKEVEDQVKILEETKIKLGVRILFGPHVGTFLPMKGNIKLKIMRVTEPLCVVYGQDMSLKDFINYEESNY